MSLAGRKGMGIGACPNGMGGGKGNILTIEPKKTALKE